MDQLITEKRPIHVKTAYEEKKTLVTLHWYTFLIILIDLKAQQLTLNLGFPPIRAATLAYSDTGLLLPRADLGRLAMVWALQ